MTLLLGQIATAKGPCTQVDRAGDVEYFTMEPGSYLRSQPSPMAVHFDHDKGWKLGEVVRPYRQVDGLGLWAFMSISADIEDMLTKHRWHVSEGGVTTSPPYRMKELSLVAQSANRSTRPVFWSRSTIPPLGMPLDCYDMWDDGVKYLDSYAFRHRRGSTMDIVDLTPLGIVDTVMTDPDAAIRRSRAMDAAKARLPALKPTAPVVVGKLHRRGEVRFDGVLLGGERSLRFLDLLEEVGLDEAARLTRLELAAGR